MKNFNCAVCGKIVTPEDFGLCNVCHWEHDPVQEADPNYRGGANKRSLNEAKSAWIACNIHVAVAV
jgi:rubredoxin